MLWFALPQLHVSVKSSSSLFFYTCACDLQASTASPSLTAVCRIHSKEFLLLKEVMAKRSSASPAPQPASTRTAGRATRSGTNEPQPAPKGTAKRSRGATGQAGAPASTLSGPEAAQAGLAALGQVRGLNASGKHFPICTTSTIPPYISCIASCTSHRRCIQQSRRVTTVRVKVRVRGGIRGIVKVKI